MDKDLGSILKNILENRKLGFKKMGPEGPIGPVVGNPVKKSHFARTCAQNEISFGKKRCGVDLGKFILRALARKMNFRLKINKMLYGKAIWQGHMAVPYGKAIWQCHMARPYGKAIWHGHMA